MSTPNEVPDAPETFVNREQELDELTAAVADRRAAGAKVAVCSGLPGVGKTTLVHKFVGRVGEAFSGGNLYVEFGTGVSVSDALASCLAALGVSKEMVPGTLRERANLWRTKTARIPLLLVLDDVTDPAQFVPFLPKSPGSAVLVTTNGELAELNQYGAETVKVHPLDEQKAVHVLRTLAGDRIAAEPEALAELVHQCAGLLVALQVAALRLATNRSLTVAALVGQIADERRGLSALRRGTSGVAAVFSESYARLSEGAALLYRRLGTLPFTELDAGLIADTGDEFLEELIGSGLLTDEGSGRYRFHTLIHRHAREVAAEYESEHEMTATLRAAVEYYLRHAAAADLWVLREERYRVPRGRTFDKFLFSDKKSALDWLDRERINLRAIIRVAVQHGFADQAWQLAEAVTALYLNRRYLLDWTETSELGAQAAASLGNRAAEARLRSFSSRAWCDLREFDRALAELERAAALVEDSEDRRLRASIEELYARYYNSIGEYEQARAAFRRAIELFTLAEDDRGSAFTKHFLGESRLEAGHPDEAAVILEDALPEVEGVGDSRMTGRTLTALGQAHHGLGRFEQAAETLRSAIAELADGNEFYRARAYERLAEVDREHAEQHRARARELYACLGGPEVA
ncbi:tetratricopeptide repeat protein [Sciscionella sediminilitoris]|uniref:tetratricopeptide repeat protein n=1 Tax=Sciscionella sediminilitoris TaxID=1445613 RepID=UPI000691E0FD|nr:tetratricopeptide repeat protein [Sciscionella sp. SE31]